VDSDGDPEHASKAGFHLPSSKTTRKVAGKASKAATKGAAKMASAFKKRLSRAQAPREAATDGARVIGSVEDTTGLMDVSEAGADGEIHGSDTEEGTPSKGSTMNQESPQQSTDSDRIPGRSRERLGASTPDATRGRQERAKATGSSKRSQPIETWDSKAFKACRPLQVPSIWDIPTSRFPEPLPAPLDVEAPALPVVTVSVKDTAKAVARIAASPKPSNVRRAILVLGSLSLVAVAAVVLASLQGS